MTELEQTILALVAELATILEEIGKDVADRSGSNRVDASLARLATLVVNKIRGTFEAMARKKRLRRQPPGKKGLEPA